MNVRNEAREGGSQDILLISEKFSQIDGPIGKKKSSSHCNNSFMKDVENLPDNRDNKQTSSKNLFTTVQPALYPIEVSTWLEDTSDIVWTREKLKSKLIMMETGKKSQGWGDKKKKEKNKKKEKKKMKYFLKQLTTIIIYLPYSSNWKPSTN